MTATSEMAVPRSRSTITTLLVALACVAAPAQAPAIFGGGEIPISQAPWQASLGFSGGRCGGVIIDPRFVLTAGHCVANAGAVRPASEMFVLAGDASRPAMLARSAGTVRRVARVDVHPGYALGTDAATPNDVALLTLDRPLEPDGVTIAAIPLATAADEPALDDPRVVVSGWGWMTAVPFVPDCSPTTTPCPTGTASDTLRAVGVKLTVGCGSDPATQLCVTGVVPGEGSCAGDSGGPVVATGASLSDARLIGVVSGGKGCGQVTTPIHSVARVSSTSIRAFIDGIVTQPAPTATGVPAVSVAREGVEATCTVAWSAGIVTTGTRWERAGHYVADSPGYTPIPGSAGTQVRCLVTGMRPDGVGGATTLASPLVTIAPLAAVPVVQPSAAPRGMLLRRRCTARVCAVTVRVITRPGGRVALVRATRVSTLGGRTRSAAIGPLRVVRGGATTVVRVPMAVGGRVRLTLTMRVAGSRTGRLIVALRAR